MKMIWVYMTAGSQAEARKIGRALVEDQLAACVNILGKTHSIYRWKGKIEEAGEFALIAKTRRSRMKALIKRVKELHSYECPAIVALPIAKTHSDFAAWLADCTMNP